MTAIILCVSPCAAHYSETISTLRFGARAKAVEVKVQPITCLPKPVDALSEKDVTLTTQVCCASKLSPSRVHFSPITFALTWFIISLMQGLGISIILRLHSTH